MAIQHSANTVSTVWKFETFSATQILRWQVYYSIFILTSLISSNVGKCVGVHDITIYVIGWQQNSKIAALWFLILPLFPQLLGFPTLLLLLAKFDYVVSFLLAQQLGMDKLKKYDQDTLFRRQKQPLNLKYSELLLVHCGNFKKSRINQKIVWVDNFYLCKSLGVFVANY